MKNELPKVSIIIPCQNINKYTKQCIKECKKLDYLDFEMIVLPDFFERNNEENIKIIPTGDVSPGKKRNIGMKNSSGEILAFIDDDAYPPKNWLKNAIGYLKDPTIAAVGGPGMTPPEDTDMQKASGYVYSSFLMGGLRDRYKINKAHESDDIHSCNFIAKKEVIEKIRWNEKYWPGEDTLMCLGIKKMGLKMIEAKDVTVYHHRRPLFIPHLKQVFRFGLHRGYFFKKFPENSRKLVHTFPSLWLLILGIVIISVILMPHLDIIKLAIASMVLLYAILALIASLEQITSPKLLFSTWIGIITTHIVYGVGFLKGLFSVKMER